MQYNNLKLIIVGVLALALIIVTAIEPEQSVWTVPALTLLVGYVVGNAEVTSRTGKVAPIVERE